MSTTDAGTPVTTGVDDPDYDLVLVLQQALEDCFRYQHFAADAAQRGDDELVDFFTELADSDREIAARAKAMLAARLSRGAASDGSSGGGADRASTDEMASLDDED
jgi:hypothetical protein